MSSTILGVSGNSVLEKYGKLVLASPMRDYIHSVTIDDIGYSDTLRRVKIELQKNRDVRDGGER